MYIMPYKNIEDRKKNNKKWRIKNHKEIIIKQRKCGKELRNKVLEIVGKVCVECGCNYAPALEVNHMNGGGTRERKEVWNGSKTKFYRAIVNGTRKTDDLNTLCKVHNAIHELMELRKMPGTWIAIWNAEKM